MCLDAEDIQEIIEDFVGEAGEMLDQLDQDLVALEEQGADTDLLNRIFRNLHTIKGTANFLTSVPLFDAIAKIGHAAEDVMGEIRGGGVSLSPPMTDAILESVDAIKELFSKVGSEKPFDYDPKPLVVKLRGFIAKEAKPKQEPVEQTTIIEMKEDAPVQKKEPGPPPPVDSGLDEEDLLEIIEDFVAESAEMLDKLDQDLVALEEKPDDADLLNRIFRNLHTIKGTANFLTAKPMFAAMGLVAHAAEDAMGEVRAGKLALSTEMMDAILQTVDIIKEMFSQVGSDEFSYDPAPLVAKLRSFIATPVEKSQEQVQPVAPVDTAPVATESIALKKDEPKTKKHTAVDSLSQEDRLELLQDFMEESRELVEKVDANLVKLEKQPNPQLVDDIFRNVHTLKGTSSFLGFESISEVAHQVEDILKEVKKGGLPLSSQMLDSILAIVDTWKRFFQSSDQKQPLSAPLLASLRQFLPGQKTEQPKAPIPSLAAPIPAMDKAVLTTRKVLKEELFSSGGKTRKYTVRPEQTIRVETERLNTLMNLGGELVLGRNRMTQAVRRLLEKFGDDKLCQNLAAAADFMNFVISDMQMAVLKTRMQPIGKIFNRFNRTVRDLARELGKEITLVVQGAETELDKSIIDELGDPLTHLLRNAVDHGIERPDVREKSGKHKSGTITLSAIQEGNQIVIELSDDGKGVDIEAVRRKAVEKGLVGKAEAQRVPRPQLLEFIFAPGFSTAAKVSSVSGRGVGMDVVKNNIEKLNGSIELDSEEGRGCVFKLRFPLTLATLPVLQVKVREELFAIPLSSVIETVRATPHQVQTISGKAVIRFRDTIIPLVRLEKVFEMKGDPVGYGERIYIVVAGIAEKKIGIVVDRIIRREEIVIKSLGKLLSNIPGLSGACIGGDGRVILILDISGLLRILSHNIMTVAPEIEKNKHAAQLHDRQNIMVVEDSRSERKRTRLLMEAKGYKVVEAIDGKDALSKLDDRRIDMVITDIEMPELDGYQLTARIREHRKYRNIPVIAVSSHKEMVNRIKGMEAGINTYLPKPVQEEELFNAIKNLFSYI